jgi:hypothetical protein
VSVETGTGMVRRSPLGVSGETRIGIAELARGVWPAEPETRAVMRFDRDNALGPALRGGDRTAAASDAGGP